MLCDNDELEVHASHKHGVHCKYFQCKKQFFCCVMFHIVLPLHFGNLVALSSVGRGEQISYCVTMISQNTALNNAALGTASQCQEYNGKLIYIAKSCTVGICIVEY